MKQMNKRALRIQHKALRMQIPDEEKRRYDQQIFEGLSTLKIFRSAEKVLLYVSSGIEVDTRHILRLALDGGKAVYVPRCSKTADGEMAFYRIHSLEKDLEPGAFGILEPIHSCERLHDLSDGLCIVPALSYDRQGFRLGFGKGYYDRFLARFSGETVGLCYDENMMFELPHSEFDQSVHGIITQSGYHAFPIEV